MDKKTLTLTEVLITIVVIGIISAITIPAVVNMTYKKELETAFKKQFSSLKQAVLLIKSKDSVLLDFENYKKEFKPRLAQEYNVIYDCGVINNNTGCIISDEDGIFRYYKSYSGGNLSRSYFDDGGFILNYGTTFFIEQGIQAQNNIGGYIVSIDINGYSKKPNKMGYDLFMFQIKPEGEVLPMGSKNTHFRNYCSKKSTSEYSGYSCAYNALTDKDYFSKL